MKVSIIIPVYNMEKYLKECLDSVFNQTFSDTEVIIINDGSTDKSDYIIKNYLEKYKNIIYINQDNQGLSVSRNNGLKVARGEFILFLDSDDYLESDCLELIYNKAIYTKSDIVIMGHKKVYSKEKFISTNYRKYIEEDKVYDGYFVANMMLRDIVEGYACDKLIKREILKEKIFEPNKYIEDIYPIFKKVYNSKRISFVDRPLYNYRQRKESISHYVNIKLINDYYYAKLSVLDYIKDKKHINQESIFLFKYGAFRTIIGFLNKLNNKKYKIYKEFYKMGYDKYKPSVNEVCRCKNLKLSSKIDIILWKLRIYHIFMPGLLNIKKYIEENIDYNRKKINCFRSGYGV